MKVDSAALPTVSNSQMTDLPMHDLPIMKAEEIKSILYLGIKGEINLDLGTKHTVDTYA